MSLSIIHPRRNPTVFTNQSFQLSTQFATQVILAYINPSWLLTQRESQCESRHSNVVPLKQIPSMSESRPIVVSKFYSRQAPAGVDDPVRMVKGNLPDALLLLLARGDFAAKARLCPPFINRKLVSEENVANIPLKICTVIIKNNVLLAVAIKETVSQDEKGCCNLFLHDVCCILFVHKLSEVIPLRIPNRLWNACLSGEQIGCLGKLS